ncbi:hypothetical protein BASA50_003956 [Batrachochytrium salamandrivorans]|uniref:BPL/LPL catalytic domain-containing protein n=1 Tax=Batrachochytrium salamandrivorans TaxID=1357716 RepID=A0ABQ8FI20_9FUNG|nr:hypothetical protein BASA50_003956 [Batrachochytrium salamandrivorans]
MRFNDVLMFVELHPNESIHFNLCRWMSRIIAIKWLGNRVPYARELAVKLHLMVDVLLLMGASTNLHCRTLHQRALILLKVLDFVNYELMILETLQGGQTTFYGSGQLIGYPIIDLRAFDASVICKFPAIE